MTTTTKRIFIYKNNTESSQMAYDSLVDEAVNNNYTITEDNPDIIACVGGDGTFLHFIQECGFPSCPIVGFNTGHLGFFQDFDPDHISEFFEIYESGKTLIQQITPIEAVVSTAGGQHSITALNEILVRGSVSHITHLDVCVDSTLIQSFSGDGILFATPVGSTAYNYSLGGAIVAPDLNAMQMTPLAPSNTNAYRCFRSPIMYGSDKIVTLTPNEKTRDSELLFTYDGLTKSYQSISQIQIKSSDKSVNLLRKQDYDYWAKLASKLL